MMATIDRLTGTPFVIPTATPESDGTLEWDATTLVVVEAECVASVVSGYTYADTSTAVLIKDPRTHCARPLPDSAAPAATLVEYFFYQHRLHNRHRQAALTRRLRRRAARHDAAGDP
jgi:hypothetical protein